jgi:tRNA(Met) C34 N-acetyltransferase TmcA
MKPEKKTWALKKKKKQANLDESLKPGLISQTHNPLNPRPKLSEESKFPTNLILKDKTEKKISIQKVFQNKKNSNQKNRNQI